MGRVVGLVVDRGGRAVEADLVCQYTLEGALCVCVCVCVCVHVYMKDLNKNGEPFNANRRQLFQPIWALSVRCSQSVRLPATPS